MGRKHWTKGGKSLASERPARHPSGAPDARSGEHEIARDDAGTVPDGADIVIVRRGVESGVPSRPARLEVRLVVSVESESNFYGGFTENLSESGVFVATHAPLAIGSSVDLWIYLPHKEPICARGTVRWQRRGSGAGHTASGMGIRFDHLSAEDAISIQEFAQERSPMFFDDENPR